MVARSCGSGSRSQDIQGGTYQTADDSSQVEDAPEIGKVVALLVFIWIGDHDRTLRRPQKTGTDTKPNTSKDVEAENVMFDRHQQADRIDAVSHTSERKSPSDTDSVDDGSAKEAEDSECTVESRVLIRRGLE
jgi:hypothetical protein